MTHLFSSDTSIVVLRPSHTTDQEWETAQQTCAGWWEPVPSGIRGGTSALAAAPSLARHRARFGWRSWLRLVATRPIARHAA